MGPLLTAGHGTAGREELTTLFTGAGVQSLVDVRRFPGSRRNPDVSTEAMSAWLPAAGIDYRWDPRLGGRRRIATGADPDADRWWQVTAFRAYAAHTRTPEFVVALDELVEEVTSRTTLIMCSESLWWRCHRRLISDAAVLLRDVAVLHVGHDGRRTPHQPSAGARATPDGLRYDLDVG